MYGMLCKDPNSAVVLGVHGHSAVVNVRYVKEGFRWQVDGVHKICHRCGLSHPRDVSDRHHVLSEVPQNQGHAHIEEDVRHRVPWPCASCCLTWLIHPSERKEGVRHHVMQNLLKVPGQAGCGLIMGGLRDEALDFCRSQTQALHCMRMQECGILRREAREGLSQHHVEC